MTLPSDAHPQNAAGPTALSTVVLTSAGEVERWRGEWEALLARSSTSQVTLTPFWLLAWWRVFGCSDGRALRVVLFFEGRRLVGVAPLLHREHRYRRLLQFRRVELLGTGEREADEIASEYVGVVAERGRERPVADALALAVAGGLFGEVDEVVLTSLDGHAELTSIVARSLARQGLEVESTVTGSAPYVPLPATWDAYLRSLSSSGRYLVKRSLREFDAWAGEGARVVRATTPGELAEGKRVLWRLHEERWRAADRAGVFASQAFRSFHDAVLPELLARGALDLSWLRVGETPVAVSYSLVWNGRVQYYQGGRAIDLPRGIRPGIVLHAHAIRAAIEAGRAEYDFLGGASQYKAQLARAERPLMSVRAVWPGARERARAWTERGFDVLRQARDRARRLTAVPRPRGGEAPAPCDD
jgi:CelD/BcsL family acetyltransferase involved in cellulose biosynthesis